MSQSKKDQQLRREWNQILRAEGLDEIETPSGRMISKLPAAEYVERALTDGREGYYEMARHFAKQGLLRGRLADAWKLHCEGVSYRRIAAYLNCSKRTVEALVHDGQKRMSVFFAGEGDKALDKGDKGTTRAKKQKRAKLMLSDLEGALWQMCGHRPFRTKSTSTMKTRSSSSPTESRQRISESSLRREPKSPASTRQES